MSVKTTGRTGWTSIPHTVFRSRLPQSTVYLLGNLMGHAAGFEASYKLITQQTGMSSSTIARALENLKKLGLVEVHKKLSVNGENTSNSYLLYLDRIDTLTPELVDERLRGITPSGDDETNSPHFQNESDPTFKTKEPPLSKRKHKNTRSKTTDLKDKHMLISSEKSVTPSNSTEVSEPGKDTTQASKKKTPAEKYPKDFLEWYAIYPRKKAKGDALKAYRQALKEIDHDELVEKTRKYARYVEQTQTPAQYVPYPATWLRASQWDDELEAPEASRTVPGGSGAPSARDKSAEQLLREQWAREDAQLNNNTNQQPQSAIFEWPYSEQREIEQ